MKKLIVFLLLAYPIFRVIYGLLFNDLTADPVDYLIDTSGEWALGMLVLTLLLTPLRNILKHAEFSLYKRMFGLYFFFYATVHLLVYVGLDQQFNWSGIYNQILTKKFILVGFIAWFLAIPLALTSNNWSIRLLKKKWKVLHKLTYAIGVLAILHYIWLVKTIIYEPLVYTIIMSLLLAYRIGWNNIKGYVKPVLFITVVLLAFNYLKNIKVDDIPTTVNTTPIVHVNNGAYYNCYEKATNKNIAYEDKLELCNHLWKDK